METYTNYALGCRPFIGSHIFIIIFLNKGFWIWLHFKILRRSDNNANNGCRGGIVVYKTSEDTALLLRQSPR